MPLQIPNMSRILPLTKNVVTELARQSETPGTIHGWCDKYVWNEALRDLPTDDGLAMDRLHKIDRAAPYLFAMERPRIADQFGPNYYTFFSHRELNDFLRSLGGQQQNVTIKPTRNGFLATIVSHLIHTDPGLSRQLAFESDDQPELTRAKPVHDEAFLKRAIPSVCALERVATDWGMGGLAASSLAKGLAALASRELIVMLADRERFPLIECPDVEMLDEGRTAVFDLELEPGADAAHQSYGAAYEDDEKFLGAVRRAFQAFGVEAPRDMDRRFFLWQRYAIKT